MTQSELRIYINTAAAEAIKDLRRLRNELAALDAAARQMRATARKDRGSDFVSEREINNTRRLNVELDRSTAATGRAVRSKADLTRQTQAVVIAEQRLSGAQSLLNVKFAQGTASAQAMAQAYTRVASTAGAASAAQHRLASGAAAAGMTGIASAAGAAATQHFKLQKATQGYANSAGVAAAEGKNFGTTTKRSMFEVLMAVNDNESAMRKWGSQIQWTGRQMVSNLTVPLAMIAGMGGMAWFKQAQAMTGVVKVYGDISQSTNVAEAELDALGKKFTELSNVFGINREEVIGVAEEWAAAGASGLALAEATNLTMQAMVLGNLSSEEATSSLIATQAQYGISVSEMTRVLGQFNYVENETGATMGGLIKAFSRTAGVARTAGMDTAHLAAMIAAMTPAAGSASEAGNGLKTIMTRLGKQTSDTSAILGEMNIDVKEFMGLPMDKKLMEVAHGFENLDDAQKGVAAGILAGGWQVNRLSVAMRELRNESGYYQKALKGLTEDDRDATGQIIKGSAEMRVRKTMIRELTKQLTSDPKRLQQAWQTLRNGMAQIFVPIVPYLIYFVNLLGGLATKFSELPVPIQKLSVAVAIFFAMLGPLIIALGVFALVGSSLSTPFAILGVVLGTLVKGPLVLMGKALIGLGGMFGLTAARAGLAGAAMRTSFGAPLVGAVAGAAAGVRGAVASMVAATGRGFAAMIAAARAHAAAHMTMSALLWPVILAKDAAGWVSRTAITARGTAANFLLNKVGQDMITVNLLRAWAARQLISAAGWARTLAMTVVGSAKNAIAFLGSLNLVSLGLIQHWARRNIIEAAGWVRSQALTLVGSAKNALAFLGSLNLVSLGLIQHWARRHVIDAAGWVTSHAIHAVGLVKNAAMWIASMDLITVKQLAFWAKTNLMTRAGMMGMLRIVGAMALRVGALLLGPWGIAIAAVLGLLYVFRDQIKKAFDWVVSYFQSIPPELAAKLAPIGNLFNRIRDIALSAFNALPSGVRGALQSLVNMVRTVAMKIYELFSYINPFARHSPSLVENVNKGLDAVAGRFSLAATQIKGSVGSMYEQIKALKNASAEMSGANTNAKREEDIGKISRAGIGNTAAQVQSYNAVGGTVAGLKRELASMSVEVQGQERKVASLDAALKSADDALAGMNEGLEMLELRASAAGDQLDAAKERLEHFKGATIAGMGAAEDATFSNQMAQKALQLEMAKLGEAAGVGTKDAVNAFAKLQGDIETMSGKKLELQFAGAGSDVTNGYDNIISGLKGQQLQIGVGIDQTGPAAEISNLQGKLDELQRQAEIMDLEKALKFDPLARQIEKVTSTAYEMPFDHIMSGINRSGAEVKSLSSAYDRANSAVDSQKASIEAAQSARDTLAKTYDAESDALTVLNGVYSDVETAIRDGEDALNDMVSAADTAISRIEELEQAREAASKADKSGVMGGKGKGGGAGGGADGGGGGTLSPAMQSFMNAEGADPFPEIGGDLPIQREGGDADQSLDIANFDVLGANGMQGLMGDIDMMGPFKDAWQKVVAWWDGVVMPLGGPLADMFGDVSGLISGAFKGEDNGAITKFGQSLEWMTNLWNTVWGAVKGFAQLLWGSIFPALKEIGESIRVNLGNALERVGAVFVENWPKIQAFASMLWEIIKVVAIVAGVIVGALLGAIILTVTIFANIVANVIGPLIDFVGRIIEAIVNVVMGVVGVITGLYNIIVGLFTGDWSRVWEGIKQLGTGIWSIIKGIWDAIVAVFKGAWDLVWGIVKGFVEGIIDFFTTLWDVLVGHSIVPDMINAIIEWFASLPGRVLEFVSNLVGGVIGWFQEMWDRAVWIFEMLKAAVLNIVQDLKDAAVAKALELADNFVNNITTIKDKVLGFFRGAKDWLFDAGRNIIDGLINGAGTLLNKLGQFFADKLPKGIIRDGFKKALGIESPAREMMGPGADIVRGVMEGVESEMGSLDSLMSAVGDAVAATEIAAPSVAAAQVAVGAPVVAGDPAPAAAAAPAPVGITPEQSAAALASLAAFDLLYQAAVALHTSTIALKYTTMYAGLTLQQQTWQLATLASQTTFAATFLAAVTTMTTSIIAQYTAMFANITALMGSSTASWIATIAAFIANFLAQWAVFIANLVAQTQGMVNNVSSLWQTLAKNLGDTLNGAIRPVFDAFLPMLLTLEDWFRSTVDNIGTIWAGVGPKTAEPARFVINEVYNAGLRPAWNNFNEFLDLPALPEHIARFRTGGPVWGAGTGTSDSIPALLSNNEHVITDREVRGAGGHGAIAAQRDLWRQGKAASDSVHARPELAKFADGGPVRRLTGNGMPNITTPVQWAMHNAIASAFPAAQITSATRYASVGSGFDNHMQARALDIAGPMNQIAQWIAKRYPNSLELIHAPEVGFRNIWHGQQHGYSAGTMGDHYDHVHWAMDHMVGDDGKLIFAGGGSGPMMISWDQVMGDSFKSEVDRLNESAPKIGGGIGQWIPKSIEKLDIAKDFMVKRAEEMMPSVSYDSSAGVEQWRPLAMDALRRHGYNPTDHIDAMMQQINHESSGNPRAINLDDSNARIGTPSGGLLQVIEPTYNAVRAKYPEAFIGLPQDRWDPLTNLTAGVGAVRKDWGGPGGRWPTTLGYDSGGMLPPTDGGTGSFFNHTKKPEPVLTSPQWDAVYRAAMSTTEAEEVARGFRNAVISGEYNQATSTAAKQIMREFGPAVNELGIEYYDASKLVADAVYEQGATWEEQFTTAMTGVQEFFTKIDELRGIGNDIYAKLEEDGVIEEIKESTKAEVEALQNLGKQIMETQTITEGQLHEIGHNLGILGQKTFEILAKQDFEMFAPIFDKLGDLAGMLPKASQSFVSWAGLETDMTIGKSIELGLNTIGNGVKGLYNIVQGVAAPVLKNVSGIGSVIGRFASENGEAVSAIMAAVATGNPLLALPFLPQILDALFELIPLIIQAIIDIVPNLINAIFDFFDFLNPFNVPSYDSLDEAVKASNEATADMRSGKYQYERGANSDWRPTDDGTTEMNFYGDLSFPNIKNDKDAEGFVTNLKRM